MEARFSISPSAAGAVSWPSRSELVFTHAALRPLTTYRVRLAAGYRDTSGHVNQLAHGWLFTTEPPPALTATSPGAREQNVDPASFLALQFSREMDLPSLEQATSISPYVPITLRRDPGDARRVIVAPLNLLDPAAAYSLTVTREARDVDGNTLESGISIDFGTGSEQPLRHWVTFVAEQAATPAGIWVVDQNQIPRQVAGVAAAAFSWSPDGTHLLVASAGNVWSDVSLAGDRVLLPFTAGWADYLAPGLGYVYLDHARLTVLPPGGEPLVIDTGVRSAAVSTDGERLAYVGASGNQVFGYTVELRSHYRIAVETGNVDALAWSPDGSRLAYRLTGADPAASRIRVRDLVGSGAATTVAIGALDPPRWQADGRHLLFSATVPIEGSPESRAFRVGAGDAATAPLAADQAIPAAAAVAIRDPVPSPDGHQLAFLQPTADGDQVAVMNLDGTGYTALTGYDPTGFPYSCSAPAWTRA